MDLEARRNVPASHPMSVEILNIAEIAGVDNRNSPDAFDGAFSQEKRI